MSFLNNFAAFLIVARFVVCCFTSTNLCFLATLPASAYYFQGYYVNQVLVSPMLDRVVYTPVGLGIVTSKAGFRIHPITGHGDFHSGVDLAANLNDRVYALLPGYVTRVGYRSNLGVAVEIYHPYPNVRTIYGHLNAYSVLPGQWVQRGRVIGYAGCTGRSTGVHVHFTVIKQSTNEYIEPMAFLMMVPKYVVALKENHSKELSATAFKKLPSQFGIAAHTGKQSLSTAKGLSVYTDKESAPDKSSDDDLPAKTKESAPPEI
jgi:murein DD-endopeptidase MepM/ murein hydrolase activator NlpD